MENIERNNSVLYELYSSKFGKLPIQEPKGWSNDVKSYSRDSDSRGITSKIDIDLEFFGDASNYLKNIYYTLGIEEKVILTKYEKNKFSLSEEWEIRYIQELDMATFKEISRTGSVTVNSTEGGLYSDIKNRESDEYDLLTDLSADEQNIGELKTEIFQPLGRKIFIESLLESKQITDYRINGYRYQRISSENDKTSRTIPLDVVYSSSGKDVQLPFNSSSGNDTLLPFSRPNTYDLGSQIPIGDLFFFRAEDELRLKLNLDLEYKITKTIRRYSEFNGFSVDLIKTELVGTNDILIKRTVLQTFAAIGNINVTKNLTAPLEETLNKNESLGIVFTAFTSFDGGTLMPTGRIDVYLNVLKSNLLIEDLTAYNEFVTIGKCIKPINFFDRLIAKITGKTGLVKSSVFEENGEYEFMVVDNGLWARGFPNNYKNSSGEDQKIQLSTSFKDAFESFNYLEPLCWFTEVIGSTEYVRIEKATHTQQNFIGISLGEVDKIEYESSTIDYFSNVTLGHEGSLKYEELNGLDEPNGKSEFSTFITKNNAKYEAVSKFRTDAVAYELTRRLPFRLYPKEDSKRDNDIWIHDAYNSGTFITHKKWDYEGRFTSKPIGIYDPDSAWNLWLSPMNRLYYGHGYSLKRGLYHFPNKRITFNSSNANQNLITERNSFVLSESGGVEIKDLPNARVEATMINFTFSMDQILEKKFLQKTKVNGLEVYNYFGLIEYIEKGQKKYGRLVKLESSEEAKITLIKARI